MTGHDIKVQPLVFSNEFLHLRLNQELNVMTCRVTPFGTQHKKEERRVPNGGTRGAAVSLSMRRAAPDKTSYSSSSGAALSLNI